MDLIGNITKRIKFHPIITMNSRNSLSLAVHFHAIPCCCSLIPFIVHFAQWMAQSFRFWSLFTQYHEELISCDGNEHKRVALQNLNSNEKKKKIWRKVDWKKMPDPSKQTIEEWSLKWFLEINPENWFEVWIYFSCDIWYSPKCGLIFYR